MSPQRGSFSVPARMDPEPRHEIGLRDGRGYPQPDSTVSGPPMTMRKAGQPTGRANR
jgi:hypothetical protein